MSDWLTPGPRHTLLKDAVFPPAEGHLHMGSRVRNNAAPKSHPSSPGPIISDPPTSSQPQSLAPSWALRPIPLSQLQPRSSQHVQAPVSSVSMVSSVDRCRRISTPGKRACEGHLAPSQVDSPTHHFPQFCLPNSVSRRSRNQLRNEIPTSLCAKTTNFSDSWTLLFICLCSSPSTACPKVTPLSFRSSGSRIARGTGVAGEWDLSWGLGKDGAEP